MRILMIIDGLPGGGAEKVVLTLCQGMQQQGHDVSLICCATSAITLSRQALIIRWWPIAAVPPGAS